MKSNRNYSILWLMVLIMSSCSAPKNIIKLEPQHEDIKWLFGQSFAVDSLYGIIYEVGFDRTVNDEYWFDFHVINRSNMPILIDPVDFSYMAYDTLMNKQLVEPMRAIDPEEEIMGIDKSLSVNEARSKNQLGLSLIAAGIDIATEIAVISDDNPRNDHWRTHLFETTQIEGVENEIETQNLNMLREDWASSTVRKTTLESNYSMQGKVFFKSVPSAQFIKLILPVDDDQIEMLFKQEQHPPY
ncbi:hypothetical protein [Sunxiuqinia indica]|uniref:hypothetical protein n=1 Tax=Sunxiuqinia indica TaxID=2692584 RepID=UPI00135AC391|nr:hypothetical protein [Sunxiuqinia indica]